jgi:teichoic acid transport system permease protein
MKTLRMILKEHTDYGLQIFQLAKSDIIKTYSGAALGWAWALVKPLILVFVFWFAFTYGLRPSEASTGYPFVLWLMAGLIPWFYMSEMITQGAGSIIRYGHLVTKMKFPVSTIPTFVALSHLIVHLILVVILIIMNCLYGYFPSIYYLQLPLYMIYMIIFFIAWGLFSAMLSAISRDFKNLVSALVQAIFWMSGILWDVNTIDNSFMKTVLLINPVTFVSTGYRNVFIYKTWIWDQPRALVCAIAVLIIMEIGAVWAYKKLYKIIPDVLS